MKISKSCTQCRTGKRKSIAEGIGRSCRNCLKQSKACSFSRQHPPRQRQLMPTTLSVEVDNKQSTAREIQHKLVDLYLDLLHDQPHTLFHPALLRKRVRDGSLPMAVLYGIMALASRFACASDVRDRAMEFFLIAKESLKKDIDSVSLDNVHASILVGNLCGAKGQASGEALFFGVAFRMAHILNLPKSQVGDDSITQEIKLRTWWSLYMIDQWSSAGLDLPRQIHDDNHRLPMLETEFWYLKSRQVEETTVSSVPGLWGYMVILARMFGHIQDLHQKLANGILDENHAEMKTHKLAQDFEQFFGDLPESLYFTTENLERHVTVGLGRAFVALHLGYHHYATLLYFPYFDVQIAQTSSKDIFVARCKHHATSFSDLLRVSDETPNCEAVYLIVAHITVVCSSVLLHTLLFGSHHELFDARKRLYFNFEILLKLKQYWPGVDLMMERLFTFQQVCMRSMDRTYTVDRWIVKFLLQHALPIEGEVGTPATTDLAERGKVANDALSILRS